MNIQTTKVSTTMVVTVAGRLDAVTAPDYERRFTALIAEGEKRFIVDFEKLDYISSAGLRALLATAKRVKGISGEIALANIGGTVKEVFDISGFGSIFSMYESVDSALIAVNK
ncbi:MAG: STAS domain-containing protein [Chlorobium sp.]